MPPNNMPTTIFKSTIPWDMPVFEHGVEVLVDKHARAARSFANRHKRRLYLERITDHSDHQSAIRVIGKSKGWFFEKSKCIGYVQANIAEKLISATIEDKVKVRLHMISTDEMRSIEIRFDIFGSKNDYEKYCVNQIRQNN